MGIHLTSVHLTIRLTSRGRECLSNMMNFTFEVITEAEVEVTQRGRKPSELVQALAEQILSNLEVGDIARIAELTATTKAEQVTNGNQIRSAAKLANIRVGVRWSPAGVPQVTRKA